MWTRGVRSKLLWRVPSRARGWSNWFVDETACERTRLLDRDFERASRHSKSLTNVSTGDDRRWMRESLSWNEPGVIRAKLVIPDDAHGPCHLTLFVDGGQRHAIGAANVFVRRYRGRR
jgi:hypothetical protein